jgi:hypothetical protein
LSIDFEYDIIVLENMKNKLINLLIWLIEKDLSTIPRQTLTDEQYVGLMSQLWNNIAFQKYVADRDALLVYTMAGVAGNKPEPRDDHILKFGQRVEILTLAKKAQLCAERIRKGIETKKENL